MTTYAQHIANLSGEDAPETKLKYRVVIDGCIYRVEAYDAYDAERLARRQYRAEYLLGPNSPTPEATARMVTTPPARMRLPEHDCDDDLPHEPADERAYRAERWEATYGEAVAK